MLGPHCPPKLSVMFAAWRIVVVRAWADSGVLKARLVSNDGLNTTTSSPAQLLELLADWLEDVLTERPSVSDPAATGDAPVMDE